MVEVPWEVHESREAGRFAVAARDIKQGEDILVEQPLAYALAPVGPALCSECLEECMEPCKCFQVLMCQRCLASTPRVHDEWECATLAQCTPPPLLVLSLRIARKLLQSVEKDNRDLFDSLLTHSESRSADETAAFQHDAAILKEMLKGVEGSDSLAVSDLVGIMMKVKVNAFNMCEGGGPPHGTALFLKAAIFNHDCSPNAVIWFTGTSSVLKVVALKDISRGEEVSISYVHEWEPLRKRQSNLQLHHHFTCTCTRCSAGKDSEELQVGHCSECDTVVSSECLGMDVPDVAARAVPQPEGHCCIAQVEQVVIRCCKEVMSLLEELDEVDSVDTSRVLELYDTISSVTTSKCLLRGHMARLILGRFEVPPAKRIGLLRDAIEVYQHVLLPTHPVLGSLFCGLSEALFASDPQGSREAAVKGFRSLIPLMHGKDTADVEWVRQHHPDIDYQ